MEDLIKFIKRHYLKNRTMVSKDISSILEDAATAADLPMKVHRYASGSDIGTWVVPDQWDVREAWLKGPNGNVIASYDMHPLFLAPYSMPFQSKVSLSELKKHVRCHPTQRDAFFYEHRLAYDFQRRLKEWIITLPLDVFETLPEGEYEVKIDVDVMPGEMLIGEITIPGETEERIALLSDYCHPGQVNDSFSGIAVMIEVLRRLKEMPRRRYTYTMYIFPETIGSAILLTDQPKLCEQTKLAIYCEFAGWGDEWLVPVSDRPGSLADKLARETVTHWGDVKACGLFDAPGNDELVFDYAGIPSLAFQKSNIKEYHSSNDSPDLLQEKELLRAVDMIFRMCRIIEDDEIYGRTQNVPIYLTRFNLYDESTPDAFSAMRNILYGINGRNSLLDIAVERGLSFDTVKSFAEGLHKNNLTVRNPD